MNDLGYYKGKKDGYYGDEVYKAVMEFQLDADIIDNEEEFGAGYFGVRTRREIEAALLKKKKNKLPDYNLGKDDSGENVKKLQKALQDLGYDVEINGVYDDKTINAVFEFQRDNDILIDEDDLGAGYFGPLTYRVLSNKMMALSETEEKSLQNEAIVQADFNAFKVSLQIGDSGKEVKRLQEELRKMNLIRIQPTGFYGKVTENAVFKFQQRKGVLSSRADHGAGVFGPITRNALNGLLGYRANTKQLIASKTAEFNNNKQDIYIAENKPELAEQVIAEEQTDLKVFVSDLVYGSKNSDVETLQKKLKELGYFKGAIVTDYYGDVTKDAVIAFQLDKGIISSKSEEGAGRLGHETRNMLNTIL